MDYKELKGRRQIFTDAPAITEQNIIKILQDAYTAFTATREEINYLLDFEKGIQEKIRDKVYRPDIDNWCVDNIANEITEFKLSYIWGNPITLVQRGERDSGVSDEVSGIAVLNEYYQSQSINAKLQQLARFVEIDAVGYTFVNINQNYILGESPFTIDVLDPLWTFVVRSSYYIDRRIMLGVTFRKAGNGDIYFTCFTPERRYEIRNLNTIVNGKSRSDKWEHLGRSGEVNPLGMIPIVEWIRSYDRMGCFERQISEMQNLNLLISDFVNDVEQNTSAIWWANNVEFPLEEVVGADGKPDWDIKKPKDGDWLSTSDSTDGRPGKIEPLVIDYNYEGMLNNILARRALILQKCNVPQRSNIGNGATGLAMDDATGWNHAEADASKQQLIMESCKMEEVKLVLRAIAKCPGLDISDPTKTLRYMDVQPVVVRSKNYDLASKVNAMSTAIGHGIHGLHALRLANVFPDVNQVWEDSKELIERYQESVFSKDSSVPDRLQGDTSDQANNSPRIDGMNTDGQAE